MLIDNILNSKEAPTKSPKLVLIYSEGEKREKGYINYFKRRSSQIKLEIETVPEAGIDGSDGNNSPTGLLNLAKHHLISKEDGSSLKYDLVEDDEVWFLIDTDEWGDKIDTLYEGANVNNWQVVQSNPCFEVWLYYHHFTDKPSFEDYEKSTAWKSALNDLVSGGFNSNKHSSLITEAIENSQANHEEDNSKPIAGCTSVFKLGISLYELTKSKLDT